jgi:hypothetical protein
MENFTFKNYTPHKVTVGDWTIEPQAEPIRLEQKDGPVFHKAGIPCKVRDYNDGNLPPKADGVGLIVSYMVASAFPLRNDLFYPGDLVRDKDGNIVGCTSLCQVPLP